uniref:Uncharacterized protein n=1 Tax=Leersia perrieri TaxID=77586 RepID=A0A0D9WN04_9ORYZ
MASATTVTAFVGMLVTTGAIGFVPYLDQSLVTLSSSARADLPPLDAVIKMVMSVAAIGALNAAIASIYTRIYNGRAAAAAANRRSLGFICFIVCSSIAVLLHLIFFLQPDAIDSVHDLLPLAVAAAAVVRALLPAAAVATFFVSIMLIYVSLGKGGAAAGGVAGEVPITTSVKLLTRMIHAAALVTVVLSLASATVVFYIQ